MLKAQPWCQAIEMDLSLKQERQKIREKIQDEKVCGVVIAKNLGILRITASNSMAKKLCQAG